MAARIRILGRPVRRQALGRGLDKAFNRVGEVHFHDRAITASDGVGMQPVQELEGLGIAFATSGKSAAKFNYPGGYTFYGNNELGVKMAVTFNGQIDIDVKPAPVS